MAVINSGLANAVATGGTPVVAVPANPNGGVITNPASKDDQGLLATELLYVNPIGDAALVGNGDTFALTPGQSWQIVPGQTTPTSVNAASDGHAFSVIWW